MVFGKELALIAFSILIIGCVAAVPGIPHQFYGYVTINQAPVDGAIIIAKINDVERASTTTVNGNYGFSPNIFYVEDPNSSNSGKTIDFFLNGTLAASYTFSNGETTRLDLFIGDEPLCGDSICNLDEDCDSCPGDCGSCSVCGDSVCETDEDCSTCPQDCGECPAVCGDGTCNGTETCETCAADCGECGGPGPGGPGGGSPGGGGAPKLLLKIEGNCIGKAIEVTVLNSVGNPAADADIRVLKDNKTMEEAESGEDGKAEFVFEEAGDYTFYVTKSHYTQASKTISLKECVEGEESGNTGEENEGSGEEADLCSNVECDDGNPCTVESCVSETGHCSYENRPNETVCGDEKVCNTGVCELVEEEPEEQTSPTGFFGMTGGQSVGAGLVIIALLLGLAYLRKKDKKK